MGGFSFIRPDIEGLLIIEPRVLADERGSFMESYRRDVFAEAGLDVDFVQTNESHSHKGVLRGLHFQKHFPQGKLVRVVSGEVFDVAVDIRPHSATFGQWFGLRLSGNNRRQFYISPGFAHGFLTLSDEAVFLYQCADYYHPNDEGGIIWNDAELDIGWPLGGIVAPRLSKKDLGWRSFRENQEAFTKVNERL